MFCPECGTQIDDSSTFCGNCGSAIAQLDQTVCTQPEPPTQAEVAAAQAAAAAPMEATAPIAPIDVPAPVAPAETPVLPTDFGQTGFVPNYVPPTAPVAPAPAKKFPTVAVVIAGLVVAVAAVFLVLALGGALGGKGGVKTVVMKYEEPALSDTNPYKDCYETYEDYVLPESDSRYYSHSEMTGMPLNYLLVARQELFARHGVTASDINLQEYFEAREWYSATSEAYTFNTYEDLNLKLLNVCIAQAEGTFTTSTNAYLAYLSNNDGILPFSSTEYLNADDLYNLNQNELLLVRNEIYARHGYIFEDLLILDFFLAQDWYVPAVLPADFDGNTLNEFEAGNVGLIEVYEMMAQGVRMSSGNPYANMGYYYDGYIISYSDYYVLDSYDVIGLTVNELVLARNEIFARHGYTFTDQDLLEYFLQQDWYRPTTPPGRLDMISLTSTEQKNVDMLKSYEEFVKENGYNHNYGYYY